jgi:hypothetical protein
MSNPSINAKKPKQPRCGRCKFWGYRKTDPLKDCETLLKCAYPGNPMKRPVSQWEKCPNYKRRYVKKIHAAKGKRNHTVTLKHDKENKKLLLTIDYTKKLKLSKSSKSWILARHRQPLGFLGNGVWFSLVLSRKLTELERLEIATIGVMPGPEEQEEDDAGL